MAHDKHIPTGAAPGYQATERFPTPADLPTAPPAGAVTPEQRAARVLRCWGKLARGMAQTAPHRGDALGPVWHELATEYEAQLREIDPSLLPPAVELAPGFPRPSPDPVIPMAGTPPPSPVEHMLAQLMARLDKLGAPR